MLGFKVLGTELVTTHPIKQLRAQTSGGLQHDCGSVSIYTKSTPLPKIHLPDSTKKWQSTYFYVRNLTDVDQIGLPAFSNSLPASKSWSRKPPEIGRAHV